MNQLTRVETPRSKKCIGTARTRRVEHGLTRPYSECLSTVNPWIDPVYPDGYLEEIITARVICMGEYLRARAAGDMARAERWDRLDSELEALLPALD